MPTIANRAQQVYTGGMYPVSAYSRIVSLQCLASQLFGEQFAYSPMLGKNFWVLEIQCWVLAKPANHSQATTVMIGCGEVEPHSAEEIRGWENILKKYPMGPGVPRWFFHDGVEYKQWNLSKLFKGGLRRLGITAMRVGWQSDIVQVSFRIAEG